MAPNLLRLNPRLKDCGSGCMWWHVWPGHSHSGQKIWQNMKCQNNWAFSFVFTGLRTRCNERICLGDLLSDFIQHRFSKVCALGPCTMIWKYINDAQPSVPIPTVGACAGLRSLYFLDLGSWRKCLSDIAGLWIILLLSVSLSAPLCIVAAIWRDKWSMVPRCCQFDWRWPHASAVLLPFASWMLWNALSTVVCNKLRCNSGQFGTQFRLHNPGIWVCCALHYLSFVVSFLVHHSCR